MTQEEQEMFVYDFIPNIDSYEPALMFGLTFVELTAAGLALVVPMLALQNAAGLAIGALLALAAVGLLKRFTRLGNLQLPVYLWRRARLAYRQETLVLPQLVPAVNATVTVRDYDGEHVATYGK